MGRPSRVRVRAGRRDLGPVRDLDEGAEYAMEAIVDKFVIRGDIEKSLLVSIDNGLRLEGEDRLPLCRAMGRFADTKIRAHPDRLGALQIIDIHDLGAVQDRQMHGFVGLLAQLIEIRPALA